MLITRRIWCRDRAEGRRFRQSRFVAARVTASTAVRKSGDRFGQAATTSCSSPSFCARSCALGMAAISKTAAATHACRSPSAGSIPAWAAILV